MAKKLRYVCSECGHEEIGWIGRCPICETWGSMQEVLVETGASKKSGSKLGKKAGEGEATARPLVSVEENETQRYDTGMAELNRVLGGGLVRDSVTMLSARPGAGKSTLLLQVAGKLSDRGIRTLYVSGEESASQIKARANRVLKEIPGEIYLLATNSMDQVIHQVQAHHPKVLMVDSVQTLALEEFPQRQGSPTQTVQVTSALVDLSKNAAAPMATFLIGHMTKADEMAGLRTLEHLVDTVLMLEVGTDENLRLLRATKNRFGYTGEVGLFQMEESGLLEVTSPYSLFLTERESSISGAAVSLQQEGSRLIPIEIEALVSNSYGAYPIRIGDSLKRDDLNTLVSILEQKAGLSLSGKNVVLKATGGISIQEKACDLAILVAIASSYLDKPILQKTVFLAEVGLTGELKRIRQAERRVRELSRLGFEKVYMSADTKIDPMESVRIVKKRSLQEVLSDLFG